MTNFQATIAWITLVLWQLMPATSLSGQTLGEYLQYEVMPECDSPDPDKPTLPNQFYYQLNIDGLIAIEDDFEVLIDGSSVLQFHIDNSDLPYIRSIGPFSHSGVGGTFHEYIIRSLTTGQSDTLYIPEVVCGLSTSNGLNRAGYYCDRDNFGAVAQVAPVTLDAPQLPEKTYVYVIIERSTNLVVDRNFSGNFPNLMDLTDYEIHAFATSFETQADFINNIIIGEPLDQNDLDICFALCGIFDVRVDCSSFDLSLQKDVIGGIVYAIGDTVLFEITVHNDGRVTAYDVVVTDMMPDGLEIVETLNPDWNTDLTSLPIDSIMAGESVTLPIYMMVNNLAPDIEVINEAEISFATDIPGKDVSAFDVDSTPDNESTSEDDRDGVVIIILENLCAATFEISAGNEPVCEDLPLVLMAQIEMASFPIQRYLWRKNGEVVSRDSVFTIVNHQPGDYGEYSLTIVDNMGCSGTAYITLEPIDNDNRFSCFTDIRIGVDEDCQIRLRPDMFSSRDVSAINDYILEIRDESGNLVDQSDLFGYPSGTILEGRIINPCTNETICWSNLHIENKAFPEFEYYSDELFEMICPEVNSSDPSELILIFNQKFGNSILSAEAFQTELNKNVCLQEWEVEIFDEFKPANSTCKESVITRIYSIYDQEQRYTLDAIDLKILPITTDSIVLPEDLDVIACDAGISPEDLNSFPRIINKGSEVPLNNLYNNQNATFCNIGMTYNDQQISELCKFGTSKIVRKWTILDWCSDSFIEGIQYLFVVDNEPPKLELSKSEIQITTAPFLCSATLNIGQYFTFSDNCDAAPNVLINNNSSQTIELELGTHQVEVKVTDKCGNEISDSLQIVVGDITPPVVILKENLSISLKDDTIGVDAYILATSIDAGSHDYNCGPVSLGIARASEVVLVESEGGYVSLEYDLKNCMTEGNILDADSDNRITRNELFRDRVIFCCQDIGSDVGLIVKATDQFGNSSELMVSVFVDAKQSWQVCDDGDPCTIGDKQFGDCPCTGAPVVSDFDLDNIIDCNDNAITICQDGVQMEIQFFELEGYIANGATGGPCSDGLAMASIAGEVYTYSGNMIQDVSMSKNQNSTILTDAKGYYRFDNNEMYQRYEITPQKDGDDINGVTTLDLVYLQEHIIGVNTIEDPYTLIAADVNNDGRVSALDLSELRRLILGLSNEFEKNKSWRFVIAKFEFDDILDPFSFDETNVISNLDRDMMKEDWIGIKIGDLNHSARANLNSAENRSKRKMTLLIQDKNVKKGEEIRIPIRSAENHLLRGLQLGLAFDGVEFAGIASGDLQIKPGQYAYHHRHEDVLSLAWNSDQAETLKSTLYFINLIAEKEGQLSDMIRLSHGQVSPLAYFEDYEEGRVELNFTDAELNNHLSIIELYQNQPNPFNGETIIQFFIPESGEVAMSFYDERGSLIFEMSNEYTKGINAIRLTNSDIKLFRGLVYYQMKYKDQSLSRKMIIAN